MFQATRLFLQVTFFSGGYLHFVHENFFFGGVSPLCSRKFFFGGVSPLCSRKSGVPVLHTSFPSLRSRTLAYPSAHSCPPPIRPICVRGVVVGKRRVRLETVSVVGVRLCTDCGHGPLRLHPNRQRWWRACGSEFRSSLRRF